MTELPWDRPVSAEAARLALELCGISPNSILTDFRVLDFGCGNGRYLEVFANHIPRENLFGIEVSLERVVQVNRKGFRAFQLSPQRSCLAFKSASFDVVFSSNVIEHIPRDLYLQCLVEIHRVLKTGGRFVVGTPNYPIKRLYDMRSAIATEFTRYYLFDDPTHCNKLSIYRLEKDLSGVFREVHLEPTYLPLQGKIAWLRKPKTRHLLRVFGSKIIGYCIK